MEKELKHKIRKTSNINSLIILLFYAFAMVFSMFSESVTALFINQQSQDYYYLYKIIAYLFQYAVTVPLLLLILRIIMRKDSQRPRLKDCFCKPEMPAGWVAKWILISLGMVYAVSYASGIFFTIIQQLTGTELHAADFTADESAIDRAATILAVSILAPIFEELLFRATLFRNAERYGAWSMVIISGITFGLWHINFQQTLYTAALGIFSCFLISKTRSVIPSLLLHFFMNLIGGIQSIAVGALDIDKLETADMSYILDKFGWFLLIMLMSFAVIGLCITGIVLFIIEISCHRDSFKLKNYCPDASGGKKAAVYITAPVTLILLVFLLTITVINALYL